MLGTPIVLQREGKALIVLAGWLTGGGLGELH